MKTRNGFVSNSSSSSFIIEHGDISEISKSMLATVNEDFGDWHKDEGSHKEKSKLWRKNLKNALSYIKDSDDVGVMIPSFNEDTYIAKEKGTIYISTSNNHTWDIDAPNCEDDDRHFDVKDVLVDKNYFDIRNCKIHSHVQYSSELNKTVICDECSSASYSYYLTVDGKKVCESCIAKEVKEVKESSKNEDFICPVNGEKCEKLSKGE